jgi:hypothetical protein
MGAETVGLGVPDRIEETGESGPRTSAPETKKKTKDNVQNTTT